MLENEVVRLESGGLKTGAPGLAAAMATEHKKLTIQHWHEHLD